MPAIRKTLLSVLCMLCLGAGLAWADITGSISGIVTDSSGSVIPGATVTATNTQTGIRSVVKTDQKGFYSFPSLAVGTYDLRVEQKGFKEFEKQGIVIEVNSAIRADVQVEVGTVAEKVTVSTDAVPM